MDKDEFWHRTRKERAPIEESAEGLNEFADLLIRFAESHPEDFPKGEAKDPVSLISGVFDTFRRKAEGCSQSERLDMVSDLFEALIAKLRERSDDHNESR